MSIFNKLKSVIGAEMWNIGFIDPIDFNHPSAKLNNIRWLTSVPGDRWYADPFIVDYNDDHIILLAEEYRYKTQKGTISELTIDRRTNRILKSEDVLTLPTHLSFPLLFEDGENLYLCPENYQSGGWYVYKYHKESHKVGPPILLVNRPMVDVSCIKIENKYFVFGTEFSDNHSGGGRHLYVYSANDFEGPYELYQVLSRDKAEFRGAGNIISEGKNIFFPTQNCEGGYGKDVIFNKLHFECGQFSMLQMFRLSPRAFSRFSNGVHTYNQLGDIAVVDGIGYRYGRLISLFSLIYKAVNRFIFKVQ